MRSWFPLAEPGDEELRAHDAARVLRLPVRVPSGVRDPGPDGEGRVIDVVPVLGVASDPRRRPQERWHARPAR